MSLSVLYSKVLQNNFLFKENKVKNGLSVSSPTTLEIQEEQNLFKESLIEIITSDYIETNKTDELFINFVCKKEAVKEKYQNLLDLKSKYPNCFKAVQNKTWEKNCKERGLGMTKPFGEEKISLEEFRTLWNQAVDEVALAIGKEAGCSEAFWGACGTVSAFSDVDTAIIGKNLSPSDANIYVTARNTVHLSVLGGHSGCQLDTEAYIPHPAKYNTLESLSRSSEAYAQYMACEKANVALQYYVSLHAHPSEYQAAKNTYLNGISDLEHRQGMREVFIQIETLMDCLEEKITDVILVKNGLTIQHVNKMTFNEKIEAAKKIKQQDHHIYKVAREIVISRLRTKIGETIKTVDQEIMFIQSQSTIPRHNQTTTRLLTQRLDLLINKRNVMFSVMNILQDKGTNSQAEGKVTLLQEGGQMHASASKKAVTKLAEEEAKQKGLSRLLHGKGRGYVSEAYYKASLRESLKPKDFKKPKAETLCIAAHEEEVQRKHAFNEAMRSTTGSDPDQKAMKALGHSKQAKYAERTTRNAYRALSEKAKELREKEAPVPKSLIQLKNQAKKLMLTSQNLLRCMRKDHIGAKATIQLLEEAVVKSMSSKQEGQYDRTLIRSKVRRVVKLFNPNRTDEKPMEKYEKMNRMVNKMIELGLIDYRDVEEVKIKHAKTGLVNTHLKPKNSEIRKILEARVGYSINDAAHSDLIPLHDAALQITCENLHLTTVNDAMEFDGQVGQLQQDVENLFIGKGWMSKVTKGHAQQLDFMGILTQAEKA